MKIWKEGKMRIGIKDKTEMQYMKESGRILGLILHELEKMVVPGMTSLEIDAKAEAMMKQYKVLPSFKGYNGFPNDLCACVNDEGVHGIPNNYSFKDGGIVTLDCGVVYKNFHSDSAITKGVGSIPSDVQKFINTAEKALSKAVETAKPGVRIRAISGVIQDIVEKNGYSVIRDLIGHGIGLRLHEDPPVPNFRDEDYGPILQPGMTIAIEPIITMGNHKIKLLKDGWTYVTQDHSLAVQVEHTIAITEKGSEVLTKRPA